MTHHSSKKYAEQNDETLQTILFISSFFLNQSSEEEDVTWSKAEANFQILY